MAFSSWRGTVGIVRPTLRTGGFEDLVRMLPEGIGVIPLMLNVRRGALDEFKTVIPAYEEKVAKLAEIGCDVVNPSGAPPFMVLGYDEEQALIREWQKTYKIRVFTSGTSHVDALHALKVHRFIGVTNFRGEINSIYARYFADAGFEVPRHGGHGRGFRESAGTVELHGLSLDQERVSGASRREAIYMLGPAWRTLDIVEMLEQDCGMPVVHAIPAQCWDIKRYLNVCQPIHGFGRLVAEMPEGSTMAVQRTAQNAVRRNRAADKGEDSFATIPAPSRDSCRIGFGERHLT